MDGGKWENAYFYLSTALAAGATTTTRWYYWNGSAWQGFDDRITWVGTAHFKGTGVTGVTWDRNALTGWTANTVNGVSAYWVVAVLDPCVSPTSNPVQVGRRVYRGKAQWGPTIVLN